LEFRRLIFISKDVKKGELFFVSNIKIVTTNIELHMRYLNLALEKNQKIGPIN
jgi:Sialic acid synthase